jgi:hypothetical protein
VKMFLLECPGCGEWGQLDDDQMNGRVSVDHASMGCPGKYHETHDFAKELAIAIQAKVFLDENPCDEI